MTTEKLIIEKAKEMVNFYNKLGALSLEEQKAVANDILDTHIILRTELKQLVELL